MTHRISDIAAALGAEAAGDLSLAISGAAEPERAGPQHLALATTPAYAEGLARGQALAALVWPGADWRAMGLQAAIFAPRGRLAMAGLTRLLDRAPDIAPGVHATALIGEGAQIGAGPHIGAYTVIGAGAVIGTGARIGAHVSIGAGAVIGPDALIHDGARIGRDVVIGARLICHSGAVIGSDGFSFVTEQPSGAERARESLGQRGAITPQPWTRIHSLGAVEIGDDVEIGANATIDRGTIRDTRIGTGTKLDNLVHVGHNVQIGRDCLICGQVGIAGSARIGDRVTLGGQCGVSDNIFIGDDVVCGGATKVFSNVPSGRVMLGAPAVRMDLQMEMQKALRRLPRLFRRVAALEGGTSDADRD